MRNGVTNKQIKALATAMVGATTAAVATMFIPVHVLENFTGSTGLSELVPAAAAPLGDTARAIIAFGLGALTLAALGIILPRQSEPQYRNTETALLPSDEPRASISLKDRMASVSWLKIPWTSGNDDITELSDLPKLRNGDIHPDAPPRRPLSAHHDLPVLEPDSTTTPSESEASEQQVALEAAPLGAFLPTSFQDTIVQPLISAKEAQPTLAEMVAQLEAAVTERQKQLAELELVAARISATPQQTAEPETAFVAVPQRTERPTLEAVPASPAIDDDMDSALAAALATLHRMNGTGR